MRTTFPASYCVDTDLLLLVAVIDVDVALVDILALLAVITVLKPGLAG